MQGLFFILISAFKGGRGEKNLNRKCKMSASFCLLLEISQRDYSLILSQYILLGDKSESNHTLHDVDNEVAYHRYDSFIVFIFLKNQVASLQILHVPNKKHSGHAVQHIRTHKFL